MKNTICEFELNDTHSDKNDCGYHKSTGDQLFDVCHLNKLTPITK